LGQIGTQLTLEFVGETEIITGGYNAEYGRATGGVVNVITKSGSNNFHGDVWFYVSPFQLYSPYTGRAFEAVQRKVHQKYQFDFGFDLGGPIVKDKVWFYVGFAPTLTTTEWVRSIYTRQATAANIPMGARAYQGDFDPSIGCPGYLDSTFCKTPGLIAPGFINTRLPGFDKTYTRDNRLYNWIVKFNFQLNPNNSLVLQYIGSPQTFDGAAVFGNFNGADSQLIGSEFINTHDALLHYVSKLADRRLQLDVL